MPFPYYFDLLVCLVPLADLANRIGKAALASRDAT